MQRVNHKLKTTSLCGFSDSHARSTSACYFDNTAFTNKNKNLDWPATDQWLTSDWPATDQRRTLRQCVQSYDDVFNLVAYFCDVFVNGDERPIDRQNTWLQLYTHTHTHTLTDTLNSDPTQFPRLWPLTPITTTTSSAITVRCQLKSCRLLHSCTTNHMVKGLQFVTQGDWN